MDQWCHYVFLVAIALAVGVIDTIAGGRSLLSLPTLIFLGLPSNVANGNGTGTWVASRFSVKKRSGFLVVKLQFHSIGR